MIVNSYSFIEKFGKFEDTFVKNVEKSWIATLSDFNNHFNQNGATIYQQILHSYQEKLAV